MVKLQDNILITEKWIYYIVLAHNLPDMIEYDVIWNTGASLKDY